MTRERITDASRIRAMVAAHSPWYHQIELAPGVVTPGVHPSAAVLAELDGLGLPADARGLRVLDIGCRDGFFAFAMEARGAEVIGIDYAEPEMTGFGVAAEVLASTVTFRVENVYNLDPARHGTFDLVLFLGVLYHLRNPLWALDRIREVTRPGGLMFVRSQMATLGAVNGMDAPLWQFFPRDELVGDATSKWGPNMPGLLRALEECRFEPVRSTTAGGRACVCARAVEDKTLDFYRRLDAEVGLAGKVVNTEKRMIPKEPTE
jgi:tRNA (mo5U34)-methyltransferase